MLTPDEVNGYAGLMAAPWDELNERILRDMVRRIVKAGKITSTAEWQSFRAQALGASRAYLLRQMQAIVQELGPQEAAVFAQAIKQAYTKDVLDAAKAGDELADEVFEVVARYLGLALGQAALIVDPEIFVIGGGVSRAGQFLVDRVFKYYDYFTPISKFKAKIGLATLGNDAGIYGAARLIL